MFKFTYLSFIRNQRWGFILVFFRLFGLARILRFRLRRTWFRLWRRLLKYRLDIESIFHFLNILRHYIFIIILVNIFLKHLLSFFPSEFLSFIFRHCLVLDIPILLKEISKLLFLNCTYFTLVSFVDFYQVRVWLTLSRGLRGPASRSKRFLIFGFYVRDRGYLGVITLSRLECLRMLEFGRFRLGFYGSGFLLRLNCCFMFLKRWHSFGWRRTGLNIVPTTGPRRSNRVKWSFRILSNRS